MARCGDIRSEVRECTEMCVEEMGEVFMDECRRSCEEFVKGVCRAEQDSGRGG